MLEIGFRYVTNTRTLVYIMSFCEWVPKLCTCLYFIHKLDVRYMYDMHTLSYVTCTIQVKRSLCISFS